MHQGLYHGIEYGPTNVPIKRERIKVGQGAAQYYWEAIVLDLGTEDITGQTVRSKGGAPTTDKVDFVLKVPVTRGFRGRPIQSTAIMLTKPDGDIAGGNARGIGAIDLQYYRTAADQVASGGSSILIGNSSIASWSQSVAIWEASLARWTAAISIWNSSNTNWNYTVAIWYNNTTWSSSKSTAIGYSNTASWNDSLAIWESNTTSGSGYNTWVWFSNSTSSYYSTALWYANTSNAQQALSIGANNTASWVASSAIGYQATSQAIIGKHVVSSWQITSIWDNQSAKYLFKCRTTNATATILTTNNAAASTTNQTILSNYSSYGFTGVIVARRKGSEAVDETKVWKIEGAIRRGANAASTTLVGTPTVTVLGADTNAAAWTIALTADTTNGGLAITVTGEAAKNIQWSGTVYASESIYA